jgi:hypothetical protein
MWFFIVEKLCPLKYEAPKYGQEALDIRIRSYKSDHKLIKGEFFLQRNTYRLALNSSKGGT